MKGLALTPARVRGFQSRVYRHYQKNGREFAWRRTRDPYEILVSEIMLQQTQTGRVAQRYGSFLKRFPDFKALSAAPLREVLREWQGLGYNRRAVFLKRLCEAVVGRFHGRLPATEEELLSLPGIGRYTAGAIQAFVFNRPAVFIETNIRAVFLHEFFPRSTRVTDREIAPLIERTLDAGNPRLWYYALMDFGVEIKKRSPKLNARSAHYVRQSAFKGSVREVRGRILKTLTSAGALSPAALRRRVEADPARFSRAYEALRGEGILKVSGGKVSIG